MDERPMSRRELVGRLNRVGLLHRINIQRAAAAAGLYLGQLPILEYIMTHDRCTQREVADHLQISPPSVATSVKRMQRAGLLTKAEDESDLRYSRLSMTPLGWELAGKCREAFDEIDALMFSGIPEDECAAFGRFLDRLTDNLSGEEFRGKGFHYLLAQAQRQREQGHPNDKEEDTSND